MALVGVTDATLFDIFVYQWRIRSKQESVKCHFLLSFLRGNLGTHCFYCISEVGQLFIQTDDLYLIARKYKGACRWNVDALLSTLDTNNLNSVVFAQSYHGFYI